MCLRTGETRKSKFPYSLPMRPGTETGIAEVTGASTGPTEEIAFCSFTGA